VIQLYENGKLVTDIKEWCRQHGTTLALVEITKRVLDPWTGISELNTKEEWMPKIVLDWMRHQEYEVYRILEEKDP
jgi:hypothetical protein